MLDSLHMAVPVTLDQHVDDLATLAHGDATSVLEMLGEAAICLRDGFASRQLVVSTKTVVTASTHRLADSICGLLHALGIPCKAARAARDLGLDSASGGHRSTKVIQARLAKARARLGRLAVIRRIDKRAKRFYKTNMAGLVLWLCSHGCLHLCPEAVEDECCCCCLLGDWGLCH